MEDIVIGVLALQGDFAKHLAVLHSLNVKAIEVRKPKDLDMCDALMIPGGESTSILKQMDFIGLTASIRNFGKKKPIFGTCAGLILMAKNIIADEMKPFGFLDISVERNAFGRQNDSFSADVLLELQSGEIQPFKALFIRAPRIKTIGSKVNVLAKFEGEPIFVQQGRHLGASFHPELTHDAAIHRYFIEIVRNEK